MQPLLPWKSNKCYIFWARDFSLGYTACNAHVLYIHVQYVRHYRSFFFFTLSHNRHDFLRNTLSNIRLTLISSTTFYLKIFFSLYEELSEIWSYVDSRLYAKYSLFLSDFNLLNAELNPICSLLVLLGAHHFLHISRIRVKSLTLGLLMSYIYGAPILDVSRSHTTTHHSR